MLKRKIEYNIFICVTKNRIGFYCMVFYFLFLVLISSNLHVSASTPVIVGGGAGTKSLWIELMDLFGIFQDLVMVIGTLAIFVGLILMFFKKQAGKKFLISVMLVIGASFIVPAGVMLVSILGGRINDVLIDVFQNTPIRDSVDTSK